MDKKILHNSLDCVGFLFLQKNETKFCLSTQKVLIPIKFTLSKNEKLTKH